MTRTFHVTTTRKAAKPHRRMTQATDLTDERDRLAAELSEVKRRLQSAWEALATQEEEIARLRADLDRERALADRLSGRLERKQVWSWCDRDDQALAAHRAARGR